MKVEELIKQKLAEHSRRDFLKKSTMGLGAMALGSLFGGTSKLLGGTGNPAKDVEQQLIKGLHHMPKAKRVIFLFQSGGPSQFELFDHKPVLNKMEGQDIPDSVRGDQKLTGMLTAQDGLPLVGSRYAFKQHGQSGAWVSDLMPHTAKIADELCFIKAMHTDAINHHPAVMFFQTGSQIDGRPSMGSWVSYGLGSDNSDLPGFIVLTSKGRPNVISLNAKIWGNGFLGSHHQGVQFRAGKDPVLYLNNPSGITKNDRLNALNHLEQLDNYQQSLWHDDEISSKIKQYEMSYKMQASVPDAVDLSNEPDYIYDMYGEDAKTPGTFAANCLLARRLAERDVRFIQLYHQGWDNHGDLPKDIEKMCKSTDQASAALVKDLKQRGLLEDTLVIWGGEFGRTSFCEGKITKTSYGRDHHPRCFTMWMAGAGVKPGISYGETDDFGYNVVKDGVHVHDFQATIMHLLGIDHERLTYKYQGRRFRLTDVHGHVVNDILA